MSKNEALKLLTAEWDVLDAIWNEPGQAAGRIIELVNCTATGIIAPSAPCSGV